MTKRPSQPIHFKDQDQKDRFAQAAIKAGFETGRGPGITAWLKMLGERECGEAETVTWESMTAGEQWHFLDEVSRQSGLTIGVRRAAVSARVAIGSGMPAGFWEAAYDANPDPSAPGYQARYNAALAYVKGVMDAKP